MTEHLQRQIDDLRKWQHDKDVTIAVLAANNTQDKKHIDKRFDAIDKQFADIKKWGLLIVSPLIVGLVGAFGKFIISGGLAL